MVLSGLLIGLSGYDGHMVSNSLRRSLENAIVSALNMALTNGEADDKLAANSIALVLSRAQDFLHVYQRSSIRHDLLLPILIHATFYAREGLHQGYFLSTIDADVVQNGASSFEWSSKSSTFVQFQRMSTGPLLSSLGALSRLIAYSIENIQQRDLLSTMMTDLAAFARSLCLQWRHNKLSEIDVTEVQAYLSEGTVKTTTPLLWHTLRSAMFAVIVILRSLLGRVLNDKRMLGDSTSFIATQILLVLRDLYFISSRTGANSFAQYSFVNLTAIDTLSQYPIQAEAFLKEIRPAHSGEISQHPLDRCLDLYFLNTAEHFAIILTPQLNEDLLVQAATPYLGLASDRRLIEIFEAAHSAMLAVLASPQNATLLARHIHPYVQALFGVFPQNLSTRQFRMAVKTLVRITSPPAPIAQIQPLLPSTILELVRHRLSTASPVPLPKPVELANVPGDDVAISEQSVLALTLIDALPFLPFDQLEEWLPLAAESLNFVSDPIQLYTCRDRFWEVLSNGEMDVARASLCLTWWSSRNGREMVMSAVPANETMMSGALVESERL